MFQLNRVRSIAANGENYLYPDVESMPLKDRLIDAGIDLKDKKTVKLLLSLIPLDVLLMNKRINNIVCHRIKNRERTQHFKHLSTFALANLHSALLMDKDLFNSVAQVPGSPLRGLSVTQISVLCGAYVHLKLNDTVFTAQNIVLWSGLKLVNTKTAIYSLVNLGYLQSPNYGNIFKQSGKVPVNKAQAFYSITVEGNKVLKDYFKIFIERFEKITASSWDIPLLEIIKGESDFIESTGKVYKNKRT